MKAIYGLILLLLLACNKKEGSTPPTASDSLLNFDNKASEVCTIDELNSNCENTVTKESN